MLSLFRAYTRDHNSGHTFAEQRFCCDPRCHNHQQPPNGAGLGHVRVTEEPGVGRGRTSHCVGMYVHEWQGSEVDRSLARVVRETLETGTLQNAAKTCQQDSFLVEHETSAGGGQHGGYESGRSTRVSTPYAVVAAPLSAERWRQWNRGRSGVLVVSWMWGREHVSTRGADLRDLVSPTASVSCSLFTSIPNGMVAWLRLFNGHRRI